MATPLRTTCLIHIGRSYGGSQYRAAGCSGSGLFLNGRSIKHLRPTCVAGYFRAMNYVRPS